MVPVSVGSRLQAPVALPPSAAGGPADRSARRRAQAATAQFNVDMAAHVVGMLAVIVHEMLCSRPSPLTPPPCCSAAATARSQRRRRQAAPPPALSAVLLNSAHLSNFCCTPSRLHGRIRKLDDM